MNYTIKEIDREIYKPLILDGHYAHKFPSISYAYGLFLNEELQGCVTYGTPPSPPLRQGICGKEYSHLVLELNRLFLLYNRPNEGSMLVGRSLQKLPTPAIIVSFADKSMGHVGYVYQATNFLYVGLSAKRTDWKVKGLENKHGITIADEFRGEKNRAKKMREKYGDRFYLKERPRKYKYIKFLGDKREKKELMDHLRYEIRPYPKDGETVDTVDKEFSNSLK